MSPEVSTEPQHKQRAPHVNTAHVMRLSPPRGLHDTARRSTMWMVNAPSGHQVRVVQALDEGLDLGALLLLLLAHGAGDLARVAVDADDWSGRTHTASIKSEQPPMVNPATGDANAPTQKPNFLPSLPLSNAFTITPLRPA